MAVLMIESWFLNEIWIIDLSSALVGMLMNSSKLFLFSNEAYLNSGVRLLLELILLCYSHEECCLLYYLYEITSNNGIRIYLPRCNCSFGFEEKYWWIDEFGEKKGTDRLICIPLFIPLFTA